MCSVTSMHIQNNKSKESFGPQTLGTLTYMIKNISIRGQIDMKFQDFLPIVVLFLCPRVLWDGGRSRLNFVN